MVLTSYRNLWVEAPLHYNVSSTKNVDLEDASAINDSDVEKRASTA